MIEQFNNYMKNFDLTDENIERKYCHSLRVKKLCKLIAKAESLSVEDEKIAEVIGLLHDYGRFKQWTKYHTYSDIDSIDHGDYGVELLFCDNEISNYWKNKKDYDVIYDAIKYHNKINIPKDIKHYNKMFCKIIRDADKIDILYIYVRNLLNLEENGEISLKVKEAFDKDKPINKKDNVTEADNIITFLAFVYDLNFQFSFKYLKENHIIDKIFEKVKDKEKFKYYFDKVNKYVDERNL